MYSFFSLKQKSEFENFKEAIRGNKKNNATCNLTHLGDRDDAKIS